MAWNSVAARAGAKAMHGQYGSGHLTAKQLAAARRNLAKKRHTGGKRGVRLRRRAFRIPGRKKPHALGNARARRERPGSFRGSRGPRPLGVRYIAYHDKVKPKLPRITGTPKKFRKSISPGGYYRRTAFNPSRGHRFRKDLRKHNVRMKHIARWKTRAKVKVPR